MYPHRCNKVVTALSLFAAADQCVSHRLETSKGTSRLDTTAQKKVTVSWTSGDFRDVSSRFPCQNSNTRSDISKVTFEPVLRVRHFPHTLPMSIFLPVLRFEANLTRRARRALRWSFKTSHAATTVLTRTREPVMIRSNGGGRKSIMNQPLKYFFVIC